MSKKELTPKEQRALHRRRRKRKKLALLILEIIVVIALFAGIALFLMPNSKSVMTKLFMKCPVGQSFLRDQYKDEYEQNVLDNTVDEEKIEKVDLGEGYTNIAFFGIDPREGEFESLTHTDSIIIISIDNKTFDINMVSLYRDTLLRIVDRDGDVYYEKANSAFFSNGVEGALSMINTNLDLDITEYALVNFKGLATIIDALGGITVEITEKEAAFINRTTSSTVKAGLNELNGKKALIYARIRKLDSDFYRTQRQRKVITAIVEKIKTINPVDLIEISKDILPLITTDINAVEMVFTGISSLSCLGGIEQLQVPADNAYVSKRISGQAALVPDMEKNIKNIKDFIYGEGV
jgi:LCP family protein required for cell wall assembly